MILYLGKKNPGALTAASPGDTVVIPFHYFNDSGASIAPTGLAATDIEILKDGAFFSERATDSGVTLVSAHTTGVYTCTISLFNTSDASSFYAAGSSYQVYIDSVTVDGRPVQHHIGCFDIEAHPVTDTGLIQTLVAAEVAKVTNKLDTGVAPSVWTESLSSFTDTGSAGNTLNRIDTGSIAANAGGGGLDTGQVKDAVWQTAAGVNGRELTSFAFDTGVSSTVWSAATRTLTANTNLNDITAAQVRAAMDTGTLNSVDQTDTGLRDVLLQKMDTGVPLSVWASATRTLTAGTNLNDISAADVWAAGGRTLTSFAFDTGVSDTVWKASLSAYTDTGSAGNTLNRIDTGSISANASTDLTPVTNKLDTGVPPSVWANATRTLSANTNLNDITAADVWAAGTRTLSSFGFDTGVAQTVWRESASTYTDTGSLGNTLNRIDTGSIVGNALNTDVISKLDTGVPPSVWANATRTLSAFAFDTGVSDTVWKSSLSTYTDTGSAGNTLNRIDTGSIAGNAGGDLTPVLNKLDTGVPISVWQESGSTYTDTGSMGYFQDNPPGATVDTGLVNNAVWNGNVSDHVADTGSFGYFQGRLMAVKGDTGAAHLDAGRLGTSAPAAALDTGATKDAVWGTAPGTSTRYLTGSQNIDTGVANQVWKESNSTYTDTGSFGYGVNLHKLRNDTGAAVNLTSMYNGTGYNDGTAPSSRAQVDSIGTASGAALNFEAAADNTGGALKSVTFVGVQTSGTFASTESEDGTYHQIDDTTNAIDIVYRVAIGGARTAVDAIFHGYLSGGNDTITIQAYDFGGTAWDTIATLNGQAGTDNVTLTLPLLSKHTGTGVDIGDVYIRFVCSGQSNPTLYVDQLIVQAVNIGQSVGYANGAVWVDTGVGNTNTESFVDGVADNPVSTVAAATTIAGNVGLTRFEVAPGGNFNLTGAAESYVILGNDYFVSLGGQSIANTRFEKFNTITDSGITTAASPAFFVDGSIGGPFACGPSVYNNCAFLNDDTGFQANLAGDYEFYNCHSGVPGNSSPTFDFSGQGAATTVSFRRWSGGINVTLDSNVTMSIDCVSGGTVTVNGSGGSVSVRGMIQGITDNSGGAVTITQSAVVNPAAVRVAMDTGTFNVNVTAWRGDTGAIQVDAFSGWPEVNAEAIYSSENAANRLSSWAAALSPNGEVDTGHYVTSYFSKTLNKLDTGVPASVWQESHSSYTDTGSFGWGVNVNYWKKDTGAVYVDPTTGWINANTESIYSNENAANQLRQFGATMDNGKLTGASADTGFVNWVGRWCRIRMDTGQIDGLVNVNRLAGDTGALIHLSQMAEIHDTGLIDIDVAKIWGSANSANWLAAFAQNLGDSGVIDTGSMIGLRFLYNKLDTGVPQSVWQESHSSYTDTGSLGYGVNVHKLRNDTGVAQSLATVAREGDTGSLQVDIRKIDDVSAVSTTLKQFMQNTPNGHFDTGVFDVGAFAQVTNKLDTGVAPSVWQESLSTYTDTGSAGNTLNRIDTGSIAGNAAGGSADTGLIAAAVWGYSMSNITDTGATGSKLDRLDTGNKTLLNTITSDISSIPFDVWTYVSRTLTTAGERGIADEVWLMADTGPRDTGTFGRALVNAAAGGSAPDTGAIANAVWAKDVRALTAFAFDTGIADTVWKSSGSSYTDTGSIGYKIDLLDTGLRGEITALSTKVDTGVPASIDQTDTGLRALINQVDTGLRAAIDNVDTGQQNNYQRIVNKLDTGVPLSVWQQSGSTFTDTGSIGYRVDKLDTGAVDANIVQVNSTSVIGTGDTGTGDTWRPA